MALQKQDLLLQLAALANRLDEIGDWPDEITPFIVRLLQTTGQVSQGVDIAGVTYFDIGLRLIKEGIPGVQYRLDGVRRLTVRVA